MHMTRHILVMWPPRLVCTREQLLVLTYVSSKEMHSRPPVAGVWSQRLGNGRCLFYVCRPKA